MVSFGRSLKAETQRFEPMICPPWKSLEHYGRENIRTRLNGGFLFQLVQMVDPGQFRFKWRVWSNGSSIKSINQSKFFIEVIAYPSASESASGRVAIRHQDASRLLFFAEPIPTQTGCEIRSLRKCLASHSPDHL